MVAALAAGLSIALAMPPWGWWPLAFVGFALFGLVLNTPRRRTRFLRGWLVGAAWLVPSTIWMFDFSLPGYVFAGVVLSAYIGVAAALVPSFGAVGSKPPTGSEPSAASGAPAGSGTPAGSTDPISPTDPAAPTDPVSLTAPPGMASRFSGTWGYVALPAAVALAEFARTTVPFGGVPLSTVAMTQAASAKRDIICHELFITAEDELFMIFMTLAG